MMEEKIHIETKEEHAKRFENLAKIWHLETDQIKHWDTRELLMFHNQTMQELCNYFDKALNGLQLILDRQTDLLDEQIRTRDEVAALQGGRR